MMIKICGLTDICEAAYLQKNKVNFAGMVLFFEKSKRNITVEKAKEIMPYLDGIKKVAVTVSPTKEQINQIEEAGFDYLQIHGSIDDELIRNCSIPVLKAFNVNDMDKYDYYLSFPMIKGFLFDAGAPGSGSTFDWDMLRQLNFAPDRIHILAGGLNADNVREAVEWCRSKDTLSSQGQTPFKIDGVDVSSGVEYDDRKGKDPKKIDAFVSMVRSVE